MVPKMSNSGFHFIIVGGGLAGLATAISLARYGHRVTVLERRETFTEHGRSIQLPPNCVKIFKEWGLLDKLRGFATLPTEINLRSYRTGEILSRSMLVPHLERTYGAPQMTISRTDLLTVLLDAARELGVEALAGSAVSRIDLSAPWVQTAGGRKFVADAVIAADGERSFCRSQLLGEENRTVPLGMTVYRFIVKSELVRTNPSLVDLIEPVKLTSWLGPCCQVVCSEMPSNGALNVVFSLPDKDGQGSQGGARPFDLKELKEKFVGWDPAVNQLVSIGESPAYWPMTQSQRTEKWAHDDQRFLLIGDAAHSMEPHLIQGAAQSIEDAALLGELCAKAQRAHHVQDAIKIFCDTRQPRVSAISKMSSKIGKIWVLSDGPHQRERDRQFKEHAPFPDYPNPYSDKTLQDWLYGYDIFVEARNAWEKYEKGEWLGTIGFHQG